MDMVSIESGPLAKKKGFCGRDGWRKEGREGGKGRKAEAHFAEVPPTPSTLFPSLFSLSSDIFHHGHKGGSRFSPVRYAESCGEGGFVRSKEVEGVELTSFSSLVSPPSSSIALRLLTRPRDSLLSTKERRTPR